LNRARQLAPAPTPERRLLRGNVNGRPSEIAVKSSVAETFSRSIGDVVNAQRDDPRMATRWGKWLIESRYRN
jgi:hypothetical protein